MITKEKIQAYEDVRQSGITNMFDVRMVSKLSGLLKEEIIDIMKNYDTYIEQYKIGRGE